MSEPMYADFRFIGGPKHGDVVRLRANAQVSRATVMLGWDANDRSILGTAKYRRGTDPGDRYCMRYVRTHVNEKTLPWAELAREPNTEVSCDDTTER